MSGSFSLFVGLRYSLTRKNNLLLSFVSLISMLGISLGVLILIVALAVINGSIVIQRGESLKSIPHVTLRGELIRENFAALQQSLLAHGEVLAVAPFIEGEATLRHQGQVSFVQVRGVDPYLEGGVTSNNSPFYRNLLQQMSVTGDGIVLGAQLAGQLGVFGQTEVTVLGLGSLLRRDEAAARGFDVQGYADFGVHGNNSIALVNLEQAQALFANDPAVQPGLQLRVSDVNRAGDIAREALAAAGVAGAGAGTGTVARTGATSGPRVGGRVGGRTEARTGQGSVVGVEAEAGAGEDNGVIISPWYEVQASLFNALTMEKMLTSIMLLMIVVIGAVNIISTLVMVVADKGADIAILRTMGASRASIMSIFLCQGMVAGLVGVAVGGVGGVLMARYITDLSSLLERGINGIFPNANIYFISHLQTRVAVSEVLLVCLAALGISFLATLYPAWRASRVQPAAVLRYE